MCVCACVCVHVCACACARVCVVIWKHGKLNVHQETEVEQGWRVYTAWDSPVTSCLKTQDLPSLCLFCRAKKGHVLCACSGNHFQTSHEAVLLSYEGVGLRYLHLVEILSPRLRLKAMFKCHCLRSLLRKELLAAST